jgi:SPP1 gp7 family putative phage head morphogenesis protein
LLKMKNLNKEFSPDDSVINPLDQNQTAVCWMDDRGVNQPFYVTDYSRTKGFQVKPTFLDDKVRTDFPEVKVADLLRHAGVNTPEVQFMQYDEIVRLMPPNIVNEFTKWIRNETPYYSKQFEIRWNKDRQSTWYIVTGYLDARDLGNKNLLREMSTFPELFHEPINDLAKVWLYEQLYYLGDRKPGHYMIGKDGNGFGVDYQFLENKGSWEKSMKYLPMSIASANYSLYKYFMECVASQAEELKQARLEKNFKMAKPDKWQRMDTITEIEKRLAARLQRKIYTWYKKAVHTKGKMSVVAKSQGFNDAEPYFTNGVYVWQNGIRYGVDVINNPPSADDLKLTTSDYKAAWNQGVLQAQINISPNWPENMVMETPEAFAPMFEKRINFLAKEMSDTMKDNLDNVIVGGLDSGLTYGEMADAIQQTLGVDPEFPDMPGWRAERIARTEAMWATNEGLLNQYKEVGITQVNIVCAGDACDDCVDLADGGPYTIEEAESLIPAHPNCRCDWTGDYSQWLG